MTKNQWIQAVLAASALTLSGSALALDNGIYTIASKYSNKLVEVGSALTTDGANINQWPANGHATQKWNLMHLSGNDYAVVNLNSGKAMEVYAFDTSDGANVVQYSYWAGQPQIWTITQQSSGYYSIINKYTGKSLDLLNFDTSDGANIAQWSYWGGDAQLWAINQQTATSYAGPGFTNVGVHDPSVIKANNQYYVFGSHLGVAKTSYLTDWTLVAGGVNAANPIFNDVTTELSEALAWAETDTLWAPDVKYVNGQYLMYYNACQGASPRSAMGIAASSNIEGPYYDKGLILRSGMWGEASEDGAIYDATVHPNAVDPVVFDDANGGLWMVYGSYSGGIFSLQLDPATGFPYSGQGYGTHLWGGNHSRIEGAYVIYAPETGYYYMFVSYGGLAADGGYNIRVARATSPSGPYYDANGTNMSNVKSDPSLPLFDDASIAPHGVKLMGNHLFAGTNSELGYVSPGHNSAYREDDGRYLLFFHTRFPNRGEEHEVRVHEFFLNGAGWPVVAPLRYAQKVDANSSGLTQAELDSVEFAALPGTYQLVNHGKDITATIKGSSSVTLAADLSISGDSSGNWSYNQNAKQITLVVDGLSYDGVTSRQWNQYRSRYEVTFTALSADGTALWGIKSN